MAHHFAETPNSLCLCRDDLVSSEILFFKKKGGIGICEMYCFQCLPLDTHRVSNTNFALCFILKSNLCLSEFMMNAKLKLCKSVVTLLKDATLDAQVKPLILSLEICFITIPAF